MNISTNLFGCVLIIFLIRGCAGAPNPYRIAAKRTIAYDIVKQMKDRMPDAVAVPCGTAAEMVAAFKGFPK